MPRKNKYRPGAKITDPAIAIALILDGHWMYWHRKVQHPGWLRSMTIHTVAGAAKRGILRIAEENTDQ